jgi:hypothetical protein
MMYKLSHLQSFSIDQLSNHENVCGRKRVDCPVCREVGVSL